MGPQRAIGHYATFIEYTIRFIYGLRLNRYFFLETGLTYQYNNIGIGNFGGFGGSAVRQNNTLGTHQFSIPIGIRYRSGGETWRFTANAQMQTVGVSLNRYSLRAYDIRGVQTDADVRYQGGLGANWNLQLGAGVAYQLSPQWFMRAEAALSPIKLPWKRLAGSNPSLHLGLFKTLTYKK